MNQDTIDALRRLAERPGTLAEGEAARAALKRLEGKIKPPPGQRNPILDAAASFSAAMSKVRKESAPIAFCPCGSGNLAGKCSDRNRHLGIQKDIRGFFKKGDRIYYNYDAYPRDCPGKVASFSAIWDKICMDPGKENGTFPWAWALIKFDHLKGLRRVPVWDQYGCCLSRKPVY